MDLLVELFDSARQHLRKVVLPEGDDERVLAAACRLRRERIAVPIVLGDEAVIAPDSSPMVERPVDEEPAIAATTAVEEAKPKPKRRSKKAPADAELAVAKPAPAEAAPAQNVDDAAPEAKPTRKRRSKKAETEAPQPAVEQPVSAPTANNDAADEPSGEPRRGWWQRTFG